MTAIVFNKGRTDDDVVLSWTRLASNAHSSGFCVTGYSVVRTNLNLWRAQTDLDLLGLFLCLFDGEVGESIRWANSSIAVDLNCVDYIVHALQFQPLSLSLCFNPFHDLCSSQGGGHFPLFAQEVVVTEKLDGGNCSIFRGKVFARTASTEATHQSFGPIKQFASQVG